MAVYIYFFYKWVIDGKYPEQLFTAPVLMTVGWDFVQNCSSFVSATELSLSFDFFLAVSVCGFPKASTLSLILTRELIFSLCLFAVSDSARRLLWATGRFLHFWTPHTVLQNSVCGMFPKCKNLLHVTFKRLKYHCLHWSLWQRNIKHVSLLSLHHKNVYCPYFGLRT